MNGAFAALLRELGYDTAMLAAEVAQGEDGFGMPFDHMALQITPGERWLADVGFGDSFVEALLLDDPGEQSDSTGVYRIRHEEGYRILERRDASGLWTPQYRFTMRQWKYADFSEMCRYHQTSPQSSFTQKRTCSRATPDGRITLSGMKVIETAGGKRLERVLASRDEYASVLREYFGIELDETALNLLSIP